MVPPATLNRDTVASRNEREGLPLSGISNPGDLSMKPILLTVTTLALVFTACNAEAKGCIKGAIVGGVAGHMAGHGKVGAAAGCAIGHHQANKNDDANKANAQAPAGQK
jgi:hypothetical protein